jgi:hypothetical protein
MGLTLALPKKSLSALWAIFSIIIQPQLHGKPNLWFPFQLFLTVCSRYVGIEAGLIELTERSSADEHTQLNKRRNHYFFLYLCRCTLFLVGE